MKQSIALSAVLCVCLHAEIFTLGVVEVTAKDEGVSTPNVSVVNKKTIQLNNAKTVSDIAKLTPGVSLRGGAYARNETSISIRGLSSTQIPVYIDGIPVYVPYDGNMDLSRFTTYDLSRIDISKGASSVLYGPNALGGAINIVSLKPTRELEASLGYGARAGKDSGTLTNIFDGRVATKQDLYYFQVNGSFLENDGNPMTSNHEFVKDHSHVESRDKKVGLKLGFTPTDSYEYVISYSKQEGEKTGRLYEGRDKTDFFSDSYWYWPQWNKESIYFLSNTDFNNWYVKSKAYYDKFKNSLHNMSDSNFNQSAPGKRGFKSKYNDYTYGFGFEVGANIGENNILKFAPSYKRDVHRESDIGVPVQRYEDETLSLALEHTYFFSDRTNLTTGISYDSRKAIKAEYCGIPA